MENTIKLTVRFPAALHSRLRRRARENNLSLNQTIIEVVQRGLDSEPLGEMLSERERVLKVLKESGLYEPLGLGWDKYIKNASEISIDELWAETEGMPPLSEDIIADRGER
jgi:hypothetical protein